MGCNCGNSNLGCNTGCNLCNEVCGCPVHLSADCVVYQGRDLDNLKIKEGDTFTYTLHKLELIINDIYEKIYDIMQVKVDTFQGKDKCKLTTLPINILSVSYRGIVLPKVYYSVDMDLVTIYSETMGIKLEVTDNVEIIYNY